jgi:hypothetical protein
LCQYTDKLILLSGAGVGAVTKPDNTVRYRTINEPNQAACTWRQKKNATKNGASAAVFTGLPTGKTRFFRAGISGPGAPLSAWFCALQPSFLAIHPFYRAIHSFLFSD